MKILWQTVYYINALNSQEEQTMDILIEIIAEFFTVLFGSQANKLDADREVPKWVKILFLILAIAFIAGVLYLCWMLSE